MRLAATASAFSEWLAASPFAQEVTPDELLKDLSGVPQIYGATSARKTGMDDPPGEEHCRGDKHEGAGDAKSPWDKNGRTCDWELYGQGNGWNNGIMTNYLLEVHFWTGGKIALDQVTIPQNVELAGECFKNFESITNGMTRGEVEKKLMMDGGLRTVSPVRFIDPGCPHFKIKVEFGFKRDARDQNRAGESQDDKVIDVSKPYLEEPFTD
jgi:hypothetical protein